MIAPSGIEVVNLSQLGHIGDIPEEQDTLEGNAIQKAEYVFRKYGEPCFSEDTGLEVVALGGQPGVHTAYYGGPNKDARDNIARLLREMEGKSNRKAQFRTVIAHFDGLKMTLHEGVVTGRIDRECTGDGGFGYDPIFIPDGFDLSFAAMPGRIKNSFSHRAKAWRKLVSSF